MRVLSVFGTRPEAIKMAPVVRLLEATPGVEHRVCVTAQHRAMLDQVLKLFAIKCHYDLDLMAEDQTLTQVAAGTLAGLKGIIEEFRPQHILVQGDTTSAFAAALAGFYHGVAVGHIEAGLRTGQIMAPWPEEANRRLITVIAYTHFAPTPRTRDNLLAEGVAPGRVLLTGNTVIDALLYMLGRLRDEPQLRAQVEHQLPRLDPAKRLLLVTNHRRENFGPGMEQVALAIAELARRPEVEIIFPVHPNPHVQAAFRQRLGHLGNLHLIDPVPYLPFIHLMDRSHLILTDSGGIQEEAPSLGKPVLVTRAVTERPEAIESGSATLVGTDSQEIVRQASRLLDDPQAYQAARGVSNPFGDGQAARRIVEHLTSPAGGD
ncbi:MAG: UDP-N-acetylglucosamine 2-epimerase (non-hydrolyzing) [Pseudomonadota bacterium]